MKREKKAGGLPKLKDPDEAEQPTRRIIGSSDVMGFPMTETDIGNPASGQNDSDEEMSEEEDGDGEAEKALLKNLARDEPNLDNFSPEFRRKCLRALEGALQATRRFFCKNTKAWVSEADHATRLRAAEVGLSYTDGRPVERIVKISATAETWGQRLETLLESEEGITELLAWKQITPERATEAREKLRKARGLEVAD